MSNERVKDVGIVTSALRELKVFIPLALLVESSTSHIQGFVEREGLLIQCQMRVARKREGECVPCVKPIAARTTTTVDRLKCMFFEDVRRLDCRWR